MNFLGMGPMELVLIMVLALIVFGPGKLPEIAGQIGRMVRDFRRTTGDMSAEFNRAFTLEIDDGKGGTTASSSTAASIEPANSIAPPSATSAATSPSADATSPSSAVERMPATASARRRDDLEPPY